MAKRSKKIIHRRLSAIMMAQLTRLARAHKSAGEKLDSEAWLKVLANILSSAPPGAEGSRKAKAAPLFFGLSEQSLTLAAIRCGVSFTPDQIEQQVQTTQDWRASEAKLAGKPVYRPMKPDTIGRLLGVTEATRREAQAWNVGTYDGSRGERAEAYREREAARRRRDRAENGAQSHSQSDAQRKPWIDAGVSRSQWYKQKAAGGETVSSATNKGANGQADDETNSSATNSSATNKGSETNSSATNKDNRTSAASNSVLASCQQAKKTVDDISTEGLVDRIKNRKFEPAPIFRLKDAKPDGLIVKAVSTITRPPWAACPERVTRRALRMPDPNEQD